MWRSSSLTQIQTYMVQLALTKSRSPHTVQRAWVQHLNPPPALSGTVPVQGRVKRRRWAEWNWLSVHCISFTVALWRPTGSGNRKPPCLFSRPSLSKKCLLIFSVVQHKCRMQRKDACSSSHSQEEQWVSGLLLSFGGSHKPFFTQKKSKGPFTPRTTTIMIIVKIWF